MAFIAQYLLNNNFVPLFSQYRKTAFFLHCDWTAHCSRWGGKALVGICFDEVKSISGSVPASILDKLCGHT